MGVKMRSEFPRTWKAWCSYLGPIENVDLADVCEVSSAAVTGWLNGSRSPRESKLILISNFIYELIKNRKVIIRPHNRKDFSTVSTIYDQNGRVPSAEEIFESFLGIKSVSAILEPPIPSTNDHDLVAARNPILYSMYEKKAVLGGLAALLVVTALFTILYLAGVFKGENETIILRNDNGDTLIVRPAN